MEAWILVVLLPKQAHHFLRRAERTHPANKVLCDSTIFACCFFLKLMRNVLLFCVQSPLNVRRGNNHRREEQADAGGMVIAMSSYACWELHLMSHQNQHQNRSSQLMTVASKFSYVCLLIQCKATLLIFAVVTTFMSIQLPTIVDK